MSKLDKDLAARMMQAGDTDGKIASIFGTSRQAVNLLRQSLVAAGKLAAPGTRKQEDVRDRVPLRMSRQTQQGTIDSGSQETPGPVRPTLDQLTEWMIQIIKDAGETRRLRFEYETARARIEVLQQEIAGLREHLRRTAEEQAPSIQKASELQAAIEQAEKPELRDSRLTGRSS